MTYNLAGGGTYFLNSSISSTATSITLSSFLEPVSLVPYTMALLNTDIAYATIAPKTTSSEFISFTGITQNSDGTATLTGVTRGLAKKYPFTESTTFKLPHSGQSQFILSDAPQVFNKFASLENSNSFTGLNTFTQNVTLPDPVNNTDAANKQWVLTVVNGGPVTVSNVTIAGTAGETVAAGNLLYLKSSDSRWWKTDADTASTVENVPLGIAQGSGTAGNLITGGVLINGVDTNQTGLSTNTIYYASNTAGGLSSTPGTKEVTIGIATSTTNIAFFPRYNQQLTEDQQDALAGGSSFGTPSSTNKFITEDYLTATPAVTRIYGNTYFTVNTSTRFDVTNPAGTTFRYTYDGTGTDPGITALTMPVGYKVIIQPTAGVWQTDNTGVFTITGSGNNYFEVTNASGVAEADKNMGTSGYLIAYNPTWTKPTGLKYIEVELTGSGGNGADGDGGSNRSGAGGGAGGYSYEIINAATLGSTETITIGGKGATTTFGAYLQATGGGDATTTTPGTNGIGSGGTINLRAQTPPGAGTVLASTNGGQGGSSFLGAGGIGGYDTGVSTLNNGFGGGGGAGGFEDAGNAGMYGPGLVIITEHYK